MAKFKSQYNELGFYVDGSLRRFSGGLYVTDVKAEIDVLKTLKDVTEIKAEAKPKAKSAPRKPTAKK